MESGTITSILTNPIYAGYTAYGRRQHTAGRYRSLSQEDWIIAEKPNDEITIIDRDMWEKVQISRQKRGTSIKNSHGMKRQLLFHEMTDNWL